MRLFKKVTIVGVGLLGGSIGLAIKKKKLADKVVGFFRHKNKIPAAIKKGVIDEGSDDFVQAIKGSDFIIFCSPVSDIIKKLKQLKKMGLNSVLITDTGSTKQEIAAASHGLHFIGSHPLAGSEQSGMNHSKADLFNDSLCALTPSKTNSLNKSYERLAEFWKSLGAKTIILKPEKHDQILALASHLPHAVVFSLMESIPKEVIPFAAGGLKDTTRIALSNPEIWIDIFLSNKKNILRSVDSFEKSLQRFKKALAKNDRRNLLSLLIRAQKKRKGFPQKP